MPSGGLALIETWVTAWEHDHGSSSNSSSSSSSNTVNDKRIIVEYLWLAFALHNKLGKDTDLSRLYAEYACGAD